VVAEGTPAELKAGVGQSVLIVRLADPAEVPAARTALLGLAAGDPRETQDDAELQLPVIDPAASAEAVRRLDARRLRIAAIELRPPSLDDVFLSLTGRPLEEAA